MRILKWIGIFSALLLVAACFMPWATISSLNLTVTGVDTGSTGFGKPAYFHFIAAFFFILFTLLSRLWSVRGNLVVGALNMAWAIRNYFIITMCRGGECPERKVAIYLVLISSVVILIAALFPDAKVKDKKAG